jgi:hypothetical protein
VSKTITKDVRGDDVFDLRDAIERLMELRAERDGLHEQDENLSPENGDELNDLEELIDATRGYGGDEQFEGDWFPVVFVRERYFEDFAREEAESLDLIKSDTQWPYTCIDWKKAAYELRQDYSSLEWAGYTYWYR